MTTEKLYNLKRYITKKFSFLLCRMGKVEVLPHIQGVCFAHSRRCLHTRVCELCSLEWQSAQHCSQGSVRMEWLIHIAVQLVAWAHAKHIITASNCYIVINHVWIILGVSVCIILGVSKCSLMLNQFILSLLVSLLCYQEWILLVFSPV